MGDLGEESTCFWGRNVPIPECCVLSALNERVGETFCCCFLFGCWWEQMVMFENVNIDSCVAVKNCVTPLMGAINQEFVFWVFW